MRSSRVTLLSSAIAIVLIASALPFQTPSQSTVEQEPVFLPHGSPTSLGVAGTQSGAFGPARQKQGAGLTGVKLKK